MFHIEFFTNCFKCEIGTKARNSLFALDFSALGSNDKLLMS